MKIGFIRALWGIHDHQGRRYYQRRTKIDGDIELVLHNKYHEPFRTYVFGDDNYDYLKKRGFNCLKINNEPIVWDMDTQQFRHKFEVFKYAAQEFDKFVFLDWDMMFIKPLPKDFWQVLETKAPLQAIQRVYHRKKAHWRGKNTRIIPCGSFVYVGDKTIPDKLIALWEKMGKPWSEELVMAKYIDEEMGGFNMDKYFDNYEPSFFQFGSPLYSSEKMATKRPIIQHFAMRSVSGYLRQLKGNILVDWLQKDVMKYS